MSGPLVVVGAGIVGVSTAIWAQRAGAEVVLIDREGPAAGTSYGNAGVLAAGAVAPVTMPGLAMKAPAMLLDPMKPLFLRWSYLPRLLPFLWRYLSHANAADVERISVGLTEVLGDTAAQHLSLAEGTPARRFLHPGDYVFGYADRAAFEADRAAWALRERRGFAYEVLEGEAVAAFDPALAGLFGLVVRCPDHGRISDPGAYVAALARHFEDQGGTVMTASVEDIEIEGGRARAVITDRGRVACDSVAVTLGAWSGALAQRLGVTLRLESERGYHIEYVNPSVTFRAPTMVAAGKFVMTPMEGRLRCAGVVEFGGLDAPPSRAPFALLRKQTEALLPGLEYDRVNEWMGHRPAIPDSLPVIGAAPGADNVWLGYGHQHVGLTGGPKTGRWLAGLATGRPPNVDLSPFSPTRR